MQITASTVSLTVDDVAASQRFLTAHLGYGEQAAADGFASLSRDDAAMDIVLLARGTEVLPADQRDQHASGLILAFTTTGIEHEERRLRAEGVKITMPLREEPWGERLFQVTDPNGVIVQFVEWVTRPAPRTSDSPPRPADPGHTPATPGRVRQPATRTPNLPPDPTTVHPLPAHDRVVSLKPLVTSPNIAMRTWPVRCWARKLSRSGVGSADSSRSRNRRSGVRGLCRPEERLIRKGTPEGGTTPGRWFVTSGTVGTSTDIDAGTQVPVVVARALTDALLGCPPVVLSGRRNLFSWRRPGGT